ncbi:MAG: glycosyltransferase family 4 protein [Ignavibacteriales bacterium]|nr:glycosyltransferase family 4 protein [Ignavibacteriales bacterium]HPO54586.1 glycosyltransferase [Ignavibacteriaceae bacterium]
MKVLFFTYYWPPSGKASLHLPLKIIKYFPDFEIEPIVVTVKNDGFSRRDESLLREVSPSLPVFKTKVLEPFGIYKKFLGKKDDDELVPSETISKENKSLRHRISVWIRMNLFIPDARVGWYPFAVKKGKELIKQFNPDAIITLGPPHSTHLIGLRLSKKFRLPHIPLFIDPWVDIVYYAGFKRNFITLAFDNYLEKQVLLNSRKVMFVTETMKSDYLKKFPALDSKSHILYWGYSEDEFSGFASTSPPEETIVHAGNIFDYQNPPNLWKEIKKLNDNNRKINLKFIGTVSPLIRKEIEDNGLGNVTSYLGFLPYKQMLAELHRASYLLVCASEKRHLPGKLFEYLRVGKPVLAFGDDNKEVEQILLKANAGMIFGYNDDVSPFFSATDRFHTNYEVIKNFDRKQSTAFFSQLLKEIR